MEPFPPKDEISTGLRIRRWVGRMFVLSALVFALTLVVFSLDVALLEGVDDTLTLVMNGSFFALICCGILLRLLPCPRCGESFGTGGTLIAEIVGKCQHCGLKWNGSNIWQ